MAWPAAQTFRIMKLMSILLLVVSLQVSANGFAQKVTIKQNNIPLSSLFNEIRKQTGLQFLYADETLRNAKTVSLNVKKEDLREVLSTCLNSQGLDYTISENTIIIKKKAILPAPVLEAQAPNTDVRGVVTDESGRTLPGVSITIKGSTIGTSTSPDGSFNINVPEGGTLVFSSIGYETQEVAINGKTIVNITMKQTDRSLTEVVVVGYGTQRKRDLTGSITSVKGEDIARQPNTNPIASLQGKVAGLTVSNSGAAGAAPVVRIRGVNSTNSSSPVYVVDGILHDNIDFLNPADIESVDVLRDPSSIAIYGLRGANGVIAITSKKAVRGKTTVNLQSNVGMQRVTDKIDVTDAAGFKKLYDAQLANLNAAPFDYSNYTANTNWQDLILRDAIINTNNLSLANSSEKSTTLFNIGYNTQDGVLKFDNYQRFLIRLNQEIRISDRFRIGGEINGSHWIDNPPAAGLNNALWAAPIVPIQIDADTYYSMPSFQRAQVGNPIAALNRNNRTSVNKGYRMIGSLFAEIKFRKNFTWKSTVYTDLSFANRRSFGNLPFELINLGEGAAPTTTTFDNNVRTSVTQSQTESKRFQQDHTLTFDKKLTGGHSISALAGFTTIYENNVFLNGTRRDTGVNVPNNPDFWYLSAVNSINPGNFDGGAGENSIVGSFGRINYSYKSKYLLNATLRRDGSSKFAPQNRWGTFGSVGAGWVVSDENFLADVKKIDYLKIRGAWGQTGNANGFANNLYESGISNSTTAIFGNNAYTAIQAAYIPDPNLRWEVVTGIDLGFDLKAFKNRLSVEFTAYDRTTKDIITNVTILNDNRSFVTNLGEISNKGIELNLGWNDNISKDLSYGFSANMSYNKNEVNSIGDKIDFQLIGNGGANLTKTGQSIGYFFGYRQVGIYQSTADLFKSPAFANSLPGDVAYEDVNGDGLISPADRSFLGTPFPPYSFGGSFTLDYKNFDFLIEGQGVAGNKIFTQRRTANFAVLNYESNRLNAWTAPGTSNVEPILDNSRGNNYLFSTYYLEPGDYFRIRTLQVGYTFAANMLNKVGIQKARIYLSGQNIKTWSKTTGYTPEAQIGSILGGGADNGVYPVPAIYTFGMNLSF